MHVILSGTLCGVDIYSRPARGWAYNLREREGFEQTICISLLLHIGTELYVDVWSMLSLLGLHFVIIE